MVFLHPSLLIALGALAVPIVIHLLSRRSAKIVQWGAMQFLLGSLVYRRRRVMLEDVLLLCCRCLLVAAVVMAVARPLLPAGASPLAAIVLPLVLLGAILLAAGTALWTQKRWRWGCYAAGSLLLALGLLAVSRGHPYLGAVLGPSRDVVLILDGSSSMNLQSDGRSNFSRAVEEAHDLVKSLQGVSTVSVVLAGEIPELKTPFPLTDATRLDAVLNPLKPSGGMMKIHEALAAAGQCLAAGTNATKQIVLMTDGQQAGWDLQNHERWAATARQAGVRQGADVQFFCRLLDPPARLRNLALTEMTLGRKVVGIDRPLPIRVQVVNTGQVPFSPAPVYLVVDGKQIERQRVGQLDPGGAESLTFSSCRFDTAGPHVVEVQVDAADDLPDDNRQIQVVNVIDRVPILIVDGRPGPRLLESASGFLQLALDPGIAGRTSDRQAPAEKNSGQLTVRVATPEQLGKQYELHRYRVIVLVDVPELSSQAAKGIAKAVFSGAGLVVIPGERTTADFYNAWLVSEESDQLQRRMLPATLLKHVKPPSPLRLAVDSLSHPALQALRETKAIDLDTVQVRGYWLLEAEPARVAGQFSNGSPWLAEQIVGQGRVLVAATALDPSDSNLPTRQSFLPFVHGLIFHLTEDAQLELNQRPGRDVTLRLTPSLIQSLWTASSGNAGDAANAANAANAGAADAAGPRVEVVAPDGSRVQAASRIENGVLSVELDRIALPGLYQAVVQVPNANNPRQGKNVQQKQETQEKTIPFAVSGDPGESYFDRLSEGDFRGLQESLPMQPLWHREDLQAVAAGRTHGLELGKPLMFFAFLVILAEVALTRWIAHHREPPAPEVFDFASRATTADFREQLAKLHAPPVADSLKPGAKPQAAPDPDP